MNRKSCCIKGFVTFLCHEHVTVTTVHVNDGSSLFKACCHLAAYQTPVLGGVPVQNQLLMLRHQVEIQQQRSSKPQKEQISEFLLPADPSQGYVKLVQIRTLMYV